MISSSLGKNFEFSTLIVKNVFTSGAVQDTVFKISVSEPQGQE